MPPEHEPKELVEPAFTAVPADQYISAETLDVGTSHTPNETIGADNDNAAPYNESHLTKEGEQIIAEHAKKDKSGHHTKPFFAGTNILVQPENFAGDEKTAIDPISGGVTHVEWREAA